MNATIREVMCPHCGAPLVVQRAAPADSQIRIVCLGCEAVAEVGERVMQRVVMSPVPRRRFARRGRLSLVA